MSGFGYRTPGFGVNEAIAAAAAGLIESTEKFTISVGAGDTSKASPDLSIPVDTTRSVVWWHVSPLGTQNQTSTVDGADHCLFRVILTDTDTVTVTRAASNQAVTITGTVLQFKVGKVDSIEQDSITISPGSSTNTFNLATSVTTTRSVVLFNGNTTTDSGGSDFPSGMAQLALTSTVVTATQDTSATTNTTICNFVVIQWAVGVTVSVQEIIGTIGVSSPSTPVPINSVDIRNAVLFSGGLIAPITNWVGNRTSLDAVLTHIVGNDSDEITFSRNTTGSTSNSMTTTIVEFAPGEINSIQRGTITMGNTQTQVDFPLPSSVDTSVSWVNVTGCTSNSSIGIDPQEETFSVILFDPDTVRANRGVGPVSPEIVIRFETIESA
jgi:hypothetical protein